MIQEINIPTRKWEVINMDIITGLPRIHKQYDSSWVIVDKVTKFAHLWTIKIKDSAEDYTKLYVSEIVKFYGGSLVYHLR